MPPADRSPRPRLLFLSQTLPFPPDSGVKVRTYHILRELAQAFDITALCFSRRATTSPAEGVAGLRDFAQVETFSIPQEYSAARRLTDHFQSVLTRQVYTRTTYEAAPFRARLRALLTEPWALVHADSLDLSGYFPLVRSAPLVCTHHDIQSLLLTRRAACTGTGFRRWYLQHQADLMRREEQDWARRVALNLVVSETDAEALRRISPAAPVAVVPNGVDTRYFKPSGGAGTGIVFVGGSDWFPNQDGMLWFGQEILPRIRKVRPDVSVQWVGRVSGAIRRVASTLGIGTPGHVPDVRPYLREAACVVAPLRVGGGTRIKILDAWAMGKAVVSTALGAEGLGARDGHCLLLRDGPAEFGEAVVALLAHPGLARRLGAAGRERVVAEFGWDRIGERLRDHYHGVVRAAS